MIERAKLMCKYVLNLGFTRFAIRRLYGMHHVAQMILIKKRPNRHRAYGTADSTIGNAREEFKMKMTESFQLCTRLGMNGGSRVNTETDPPLSSLLGC